MMKTFTIVFMLLVSYSDGARILGVIPTPSYSHQQVFWPIWKELSLRGHQVTTITTDTINDPNLVNLTEINLHSAYNIWNRDIIDITSDSSLRSMYAMLDRTIEINEHILSHPDVEALIKNEEEHFDVVIVEYVPTSMLAFGQRFKAPIIAITCFDTVIELHYLMGNPIHFMQYPNYILPVHYDMTFKDRLVVVAFEVFRYYLVYTYDILRDETIRKHFGTDYMFVRDLKKEIHLVLTNSDHIFHKVKPLLPTIVEFGAGSHRVPRKPLPKDLEKSLDAAKDGFIYFSLGSNVKSKFLSKKVRNVILETFADLPYTVLWKFEEDNLLNKSSNVITSKWLPQQDILKHPNIKVFITQAGLMSMDEAIYDHVPMLALPFFADQPLNADRMVAKGFGLSLNYKTMTKEDFKGAILELIRNPRYKNRIKELAQLAQDQPMTGLEKAMWWIEYVIRHNGTKHLRSPYLDMPVHQRYYLDIITFFALLFATGFSIFVFLTKQIFRLFSVKKKIKSN